MYHSKKKEKHLPMMGVGPFYGVVIVAVTVIAVIAGKSEVFETGRIDFLKIPLSVIGILLIMGNIFFLPLFFFYWIFMTVLMEYTEEKWLKNLYGREYEDYCGRVNRCIPLPKKK